MSVVRIRALFVRVVDEGDKITCFGSARVLMREMRLRALLVRVI